MSTEIVRSERFECDCHDHMLIGTVSDWDDWKWIELAMWQSGRRGDRYGWHYRFQHIWRILRTGSPYSDFVSMDAETAERLQEWLGRAVAQLREVGPNGVAEEAGA